MSIGEHTRQASDGHRHQLCTSLEKLGALRSVQEFSQTRVNKKKSIPLKRMEQAIIIFSFAPS